MNKEGPEVAITEIGKITINWEEKIKNRRIGKTCEKWME